MRLLSIVTLGLASCGLFACADETSTPAEDGALAAQEAAPAAADACDRKCLIGFMQTYLDALVKRDVSLLPLAATVRYTENGRVLQPGDGIWKTARALVPRTRLDFADPVQGQVATQTVVDEGARDPVIYQARLKVVRGKITEIEAMTMRRGQDAGTGNFFRPAGMVTPPAFLAAIAPSQRMSRSAMNALTEQYLDYLEGKRPGTQVPFASTCSRYENGVSTGTGASLARQRWSFQVVRRTLIIDEEAGITWGMYPFYRRDPAELTPLVVGEAFKLVDGKITMIQAVMTNMLAKAWD